MAYPGETFTGRIAFIDPVLNKDTRTVKVRVNVPNEDGRLKPEMFVRAVVQSKVAAGGRVLDAGLVGKWISPMHPEIVKDKPGNCDICGMPLVRAETLGYVTALPSDESKPLVIPVSAAMVTGRRAIVYVEVPKAKEPTFEGREIVLGPRAGAYYLVRNGLKESELVVTNGNFKLDSALQISAKPSMMTPEGGGGGGHDHGGDKKPKEGETAGHQMVLSSQLKSQLGQIIAVQDELATAVEEADLAKIRAAFDLMGRAMVKVDEKQLIGHAKLLWGELSMLLGNDVAEGREIATLQDADRVYLVLKRHIQRLRESFGLHHGDHQPQLVRFDVPETFQKQLARLWEVYQPIGRSLAADDLPAAKKGIGNLRLTLDTIDAKNLEGAAASAWQKEQANLVKNRLRPRPGCRHQSDSICLCLVFGRNDRLSEILRCGATPDQSSSCIVRWHLRVVEQVGFRIMIRPAIRTTGLRCSNAQIALTRSHPSQRNQHLTLGTKDMIPNNRRATLSVTVDRNDDGNRFGK